MGAAPFEFWRRGRIWQYRFRVDGQRTQGSTRESDRITALRIAQDAYHAARLRARGEEPEPTLEELVDQWVKAHVLCLSRSHVEGVERFGQLHLGPLRGMRIGQITTPQVEAARNAFLASHSKSSANQWLAHLRLLTKWALSRRMIRAMPWQVRKLKVQRAPKRLLPVDRTAAWLEEIDRLTVKEPALGMAVRVMMGLGLREVEALRARWEWLDLLRGTYTPGETKGREAWARPVPAWLLEALRPQAKAWGFIVPAQDGRLLTPQRIQRVLDKACGAIGIPRLTAHRLRGTYATLLAEAGVPIQDIQRALGHKDIRTTVGYLEGDLGRVARAQIILAAKWGMGGRKSGAPRPADPEVA